MVVATCLQNELRAKEARKHSDKVRRIEMEAQHRQEKIQLRLRELQEKQQLDASPPRQLIMNKPSSSSLSSLSPSSSPSLFMSPKNSNDGNDGQEFEMPELDESLSEIMSVLQNGIHSVDHEDDDE